MVIEGGGGPQANLALQEVPAPSPGPSDLVVAVRYAGKVLLRV